MSAKYAFYGHHKCATTWMRGIIDFVCSYTGRRFDVFDNPSQFGDDLPAYLANNPVDFFAFTNASRKHLGSAESIPGFHLIRDPRDIIVSGYFSHKKSHPTNGWPELIAHRERLNALDQEQGLLEEIKFSEPWIRDIESWNYELPNVLEIKYEAFVLNPVDTTMAAFEHLGLVSESRIGLGMFAGEAMRELNAMLHRKSRKLLPYLLKRDQVPEQLLASAIYEKRFARHAKGRKPGEENINSHYRKGQAGDWANHFTDTSKARFKEQYPDLLVKLGYESDNDW